ncbi:DUF1990 family protein [Streptomyces iconiensis]|uniref:DUF1990 domain-containing protein n=1 Tax=Streptomyces iconiensis TaxID=1384038 RepID=A0ABT7A8P4_9ACTN|nr:DUF1990 domain-containing protein [Streptomyces iconiensis]MDJ1137700.1 DUF1990 domain-containing protein [Streptomyces iconiensis]
MTPPPSRETALTYTPVGATAGGVTPPGFGGLCARTRLGTGDAVFRAASEALMTWRMHRRMGVRVTTGAPRAAPGAEVTVGLGVGPFRMKGPCRVVWTVEEERETGWAYGTLPGHPAVGEEAFLVRAEDDGSVWLTVTAYSRPGTWFLRAAGPLMRLFQRAYARRCGQVLRRMVAGAGTSAGR